MGDRHGGSCVVSDRAMGRSLRPWRHLPSRSPFVILLVGTCFTVFKSCSLVTFSGGSAALGGSGAVVCVGVHLAERSGLRCTVPSVRRLPVPAPTLFSTALVVLFVRREGLRCATSRQGSRMLSVFERRSFDDGAVDSRGWSSAPGGCADRDHSRLFERRAVVLNTDDGRWRRS